MALLQAFYVDFLLEKILIEFTQDMQSIIHMMMFLMIIFVDPFTNLFSVRESPNF